MSPMKSLLIWSIAIVAIEDHRSSISPPGRSFGSAVLPSGTREGSQVGQPDATIDQSNLFLTSASDRTSLVDPNLVAGPIGKH